MASIGYSRYDLDKEGGLVVTITPVKNLLFEVTVIPLGSGLVSIVSFCSSPRHCRCSPLEVVLVLQQVIAALALAYQSRAQDFHFFTRLRHVGLGIHSE
jgi:hypothetical protein